MGMIDDLPALYADLALTDRLIARLERADVLPDWQAAELSIAAGSTRRDLLLARADDPLRSRPLPPELEA